MSFKSTLFAYFKFQKDLIESYASPYVSSAPRVQAHEEHVDKFWMIFGSPENRPYELFNEYFESQYDWGYWRMTLVFVPVYYFLWVPFVAPIGDIFFPVMMTYFLMNPGIENEPAYADKKGDMYLFVDIHYWIRYILFLGGVTGHQQPLDAYIWGELWFFNVGFQIFGWLTWNFFYPLTCAMIAYDAFTVTAFYLFQVFEVKLVPG